MKYILTLVMCSIMEGKTTCLPPFQSQIEYVDAYDCMIDGYQKSHDKIVELGREDVNKFNIYIRFGCNESQSNKPQYRVSTSNKRFRVLISGRRFGKTFLTIIEMMKYASQPNQTIWYIAPTLKMAKEICWNDLKETLNKYKWVEDINETTLTIRIRKTNSTISLKGAENFDSLRGSGIDFLVLDEFADIDKRTWFEVLRASVADTKGKVLMCGTP